jgi:hypothetical protein
MKEFILHRGIGHFLRLLSVACLLALAALCVVPLDLFAL